MIRPNEEQKPDVRAASDTSPDSISGNMSEDFARNDESAVSATDTAKAPKSRSEKMLKKQAEKSPMAQAERVLKVQSANAYPESQNGVLDNEPHSTLDGSSYANVVADDIYSGASDKAEPSENGYAMPTNSTKPNRDGYAEASDSKPDNEGYAEASDSKPDNEGYAEASDSKPDNEGYAEASDNSDPENEGYERNEASVAEDSLSKADEGASRSSANIGSVPISGDTDRPLSEGSTFENDIRELISEFPELHSALRGGISTKRYGELRSLGLSVREAYLAASAPRGRDNRAHLISGVPSGARGPELGMNSKQMEIARSIFPGLPEQELKRLYSAVIK